VQDAQMRKHLSRDVDPRQLAFGCTLGMGANWAFQLYQDHEAFARARSAIRQRLQAAAPLAPFEVEVDEGAARRTLRTQIARLERELASLFASARPGDDLDWRVGVAGAPRVLDIGDLEGCATTSPRGSRRSAARSASGPRAGGSRGRLGDRRGPRGGWRRVRTRHRRDGCKHYH
jgi:hypothetical protein